ncbi:MULTISPECIES: hypothetical protein [Planktothricoides]|nr:MULTISPECIES: hypothetical protein [Planktothricoides]
MTKLGRSEDILSIPDASIPSIDQSGGSQVKGFKHLISIASHLA